MQQQPRFGLAAALIFSAVAPLMFYVMPMFLGAVAEQLNWPDRQLANLVSAEYLGKTCGTLLVALLIGKLSWNRLGLAGALIFAGCNFLSIAMDSFATLAPVRCMAGIGSAIIYALALVYIGRTPTPERNFGYLLAIQTLLQSALLWWSPELIAVSGMDGLLVLFGMLAIPAVFAARFIVKLDARHRGGGVPAPRGAHARSVVTVLAYLFFNMALGSGWTFIERIGNVNGMSTELIGRILSVAMAFSAAGGLAASVLGLRVGRVPPFLSGALLMSASLMLLAGEVVPATYALGAGGFLFFWNFLGVYLLGLIAGADVTGRYVALAPVALTAGFGIGPFACSFLLGDGQFRFTTWLAVGFLAASAAFFVHAARTRAQFSESSLKVATP